MVPTAHPHICSLRNIYKDAFRLYLGSSTCTKGGGGGGRMITILPPKEEKVTVNALIWSPVENF